VRISTPNDKNDLRLVFELNAEVQHKAFALKPFQQYGDRLVIDLNDKSEKTAIVDTPSDDDRDVIIAIDAGHGGDDPGAVGPKKTYEKNITLAIAKKLAAQINNTSGMKAVLTRSGDYFVPLRKRTDIARRQKADLLVSIHADSFKDKSVRGASVWALSHKGAQNEIGRWLEEKETASDLLGGEEALDLASYDDDVAKVLLDLSMYNAVGSSLDVGASVLSEMKDVVPKLHKPRVQQAGFIVLKNPDIPAILVETAFLSNPNEEKLLLDLKHQDRLASAVLSGVKSYFEQHPPEGTKLAQIKANKKRSSQLFASKAR
jgi:N-acetylmuramoyl-L-alanine amidase